jgi:hypothetical protein
MLLSGGPRPRLRGRLFAAGPVCQFLMSGFWMGVEAGQESGQ